MKRSIAWLIILLIAQSSLHAQDIVLYHNHPPSSGDIDVALTNLILQAQSSVDMASYILDRDIIIDALKTAKTVNQIDVRLIAESDYYYENLDSVYRPLEDVGIDIVKDTDGFGGNGEAHNKFVVIDGNKVWTGSYNFSRAGTIRNSNDAVLIQSTALAAQFTTEFNEMFIDHHFGVQKIDNHSDPQRVTAGGSVVEYYFSPTDGTASHILDAIDTAQYSIHFLIFSFTRNDIGDILVAKHNAGLEVKGVFDEDNRLEYGGEYIRLMEAGLPVRYDQFQYKLHHKLMIIDYNHPESDPLVITGSYNWSTRAENENDENIVIIHDTALAQSYHALFNDIYVNHAISDNVNPLGRLAINEIMTNASRTSISFDDQTNWGQSDGIGGTPQAPESIDTTPPIIKHTPVLSAIAGQSINIYFDFFDPDDPEQSTAYARNLYYRVSGEPQYTRQPMRTIYDQYMGTIPSEAVTGEGIDYYISCMDKANNLSTSPPLNAVEHPYHITISPPQ